MKILLTLLLLMTATLLQATELKLVVPYSPGGSSDRVARLIEQELTDSKYKVIIEYRLGAGGSVAANYVASVRNETVLFMASTGLVTATNVNYNVETDFVLVDYIGTDPLLLVVKSDGTIRTFKDLIVQSREKFLPYGSAGIGTSSHIAAAIVSKNNSNFIHVPYKGSAAALTDLLSGNILWEFDSHASIGEFITSGRIKPIAVYGKNRMSAYPTIPTLKELGYNDYGIYRWHALVANRDADPQVIQYINDRLNRAEFKQKIQDLHIDTVKPAHVNRFFQHEANQARQLFQGIKLQ